MLYELVKGKVASDEFYGFKGPRLEGTLGSGGSAAQRKASRAKVRPASSSSAYAHQQHQQQRRPQSGVSEMLRPVSAPVRISAPTADPDIANDDMDAPTDMDVKIAELSSKIDRLTEIILSMQRERSRDASQHTEPAS